MDSGFKDSLIATLREELEAAKTTDKEKVAAEVRTIGFSCLMCGRCCRREQGDNSVIVSPAEIQRICRYTGLEHGSVTKPPQSESDIPDLLAEKGNTDLIDPQGNIHTFGWELSRRENGDCVFMQEKREGNRCAIYDARPMLCSTYPFYMEDGELKVSECEGLGGETGFEESLVMAGKVIERYVEEIKETILLYENYGGFRKGPENINKAIANIREGIINYIVHDSTGSHRTTLRIVSDHNIKD
ncbi:YkgJ family cysteine cluster protein [Methanolobus chelungpuianus]|uniref:YkgJ family cysteine cluster protein n=1 Tax=Methanolobus chelungpuianus TaxID=502115 RepID=UPI002114A09E|nr:YkgJ family cysteine cluster protein [Methanolobus chelungpuianus]